MFEAQLKQGALLKKSIEAIKDILTEANFDCSSSGIAMQSMDRASVVLVVLQLKASVFDAYRCDRNVALGVSMGSLAKIMKCGSVDDAITLRADDRGECLGLVFEDEQVGRISEYELRLLDVNAERIALPESAYESYARIPAPEFQRIVRDLANIDDSVVVSVQKDQIRFRTKGDLGTGSVILKHNRSDASSESTARIICNTPVSASLSLKFLNQFTKATSLSATVTLGLTDGEPVLVEYPFDEAGYLRFYLAPKVTDEEEEGDADEEDNNKVMRKSGKPVKVKMEEEEDDY